MATSPLHGITGSDGHAPGYEPNARWCWWDMNEIYTGQAGLYKHVPKVGDYVRSRSEQKTYEVISLDAFTLLTVLEDIDGGSISGLVDTASNNFLAYLDTRVVPHVFTLDARWLVHGTMTNYCKIFKGPNAREGSKVLSFLYDNAGNFLTNNIPLEPVSIDNHTNIATKVVQQCHTNEALHDGEIVTAVVYNAEGHVMKKDTFRVENTGFVRSVSAGTKYVESISLESPFLSPMDAHRLDYPLNVPLQAYNMTGVVNYSDGSAVKLPVDGTRFRMGGLERFVATAVGQEIPLVLMYTLDPTEVAYGDVSVDGKTKTAAYKLVAAAQDGAFSVKLFGYPQWTGSSTGYTMRWFLMDLNRDIMIDATPFVYYNSNGDTYAPLAYNQIQNISVRVNLRDISNAFASYIHTQTYTVVLKNPGTDATGTHWLVASDPGQDPMYGNNLYANVTMVNQNLWSVRVDSGIENQVLWLEQLYKATRPVLDRKKELAPPVPTHFVVFYQNNRYEFPIASWNQTLTVTDALPLTGTVYVEFIRRSGTDDLRLAVAGLPVRSSQPAP